MNERRPSRTHRARLGACLAAALALAPLTARAQQTDDVAELMAAAQADYVAGRYAEAEQKAETAWAKKRAVDIATVLGQIEEKQGKLAEAAEHLDYARKNLNISESDEVRKKIETLFEQVRKQSGAFILKTNASGATMKVTGREGTFVVTDDPTFVPPGKVTITVSKEGYKDGTISTTTVAGETTIVSLELEKVAADIGPTPGGDERPVWPAIVLGAVAAGGLGMGIAGIVVSQGAQSDADDAADGRAPGSCQPDGSACAEIEDSLSDVNTFRGVGIAGFALAAAAGLGAVLYVAIPDDEPETAIRISPFVGRASGFLLHGSF